MKRKQYFHRNQNHCQVAYVLVVHFALHVVEFGHVLVGFVKKVNVIFSVEDVVVCSCMVF